MQNALKEDGIPDIAQAAAAIGMVPFPEQTTVARRLAETVARGGVGFIEAPTATGKTLAICHSAMATAMTTGRPCIIAVPTVAIGHQTMTTIDDLRSASEGFRWLRTRIVVGRQDFLSPAGLEDLIDTVGPQAAASITGWISDGAPGRTPSHSAWTLDGLENRMDHDHVGGIDLSGRSSLALGASDADSDAQRSYERQFSSDADVVVVTHAMLGRDLLSRYVATSKERKRLGMTVDAGLTPAERWLAANQQRLEIETGGEGRLPDHRNLIVDEAHLLRESIESSMSTSISLCSLDRQCAALAKCPSKPVPTKAMKQIRLIRKELIARAEENGSSIRMSWSREDPLQSIMTRLGSALSAIRTTKVRSDLEHEAVGVARARYAIEESIRARDAVSTIFEWSPVRAFPSITVGRRNLRSELDFLWNRLESAALVSATLYTDNVAGPSLGYMSNRLHVPARSIIAFPPIIANWIRRPVKAFIPGLATAQDLEPGDDVLRLDAIAAHIVRIVEGGSRGTLVLSTSRADSAALSERLRDLLGDERVIDGTRDRLTRLKALHVTKARAGLCPVWLAQGPAWTGLDLPDDVIETLVITRLPFPKPDAAFGGERSHYGVDKIARMGMTVKQGVGRLVRTRSASPKTLHFLDGRIRTVKSAGMALALARSYGAEEF